MATRLIHLLAIVIFTLLPSALTAQTAGVTDTGAVADNAKTVKQHRNVSKKHPNHKTVAVISSFTQESPWSNDNIPAVTMAVSKEPNTTCELFYLNSFLITNDSIYEKVKSNMFEYFADKTPDYVVMIGKLAFCMRDDMKKEWGDVPILLIANSPNMASLSYYMSGETIADENQDQDVRPLSALQKDYNFTAIIEPYFLKEEIELMIETMNHDINELVYVAVPTYLERNNSRRIADYLTEHYPGIKYRWLVADPQNVAAMRSLLAERQPGVGILLANWATPIEGPFGNAIISNQEVKMMSSSLNPIFVNTSSLIDNGAVGGVYCDKEVVHERIATLVGRMLSGENLSEIPIYTCKKSKEVINYNRAKQFGLNLKDLGSGVEKRGLSRSFWQKYHWEAIGVSIVLLLLVFVFWKRNQIQTREIKTLQDHNKFVANMPVAYAHVIVNYDRSGKNVTNIRYSNVNGTMQELVNKNGCKTGEYVLFPIPYLSEKVKEVFDKGEKVEFVHYFEATDSYYDVFMDISSTAIDKTQNVKELEIFAVDVTNRVRMEKELKALSRKLDLTINVAGIIPWEWDIKTDVLRFDAYSLFGRQLHDVDDMQETPSTYLDVNGEFSPLIHDDDIEATVKIRQGLLTKTLSSFKVRYRLRMARDNQNVYQWVEVKGRVIEYDAKGNPATCAGAMWVIDDDIVSAPMDY